MTLLQRIRDTGARRRLAGSTVVCYQSWIREFLRFSRDGRGWRHPRDLGAHDVEAFLNHLALHKRVAASTQNQAICAIVFLYRQVLAEELGPEHLGRFVAERARRPRRVPTVLSAVEVQRVFDVLQVRLRPPLDDSIAVRRRAAD